MRKAALGCGHCVSLSDGEEIPRELDCPECRKPVRVLVIWPVDDSGNIIHWYLS